MLNFFRKYQKIFFVVITVVIVISFSFFGTFNTMADRSELPDRELVKGVTGKPIMQKELNLVCQLISSSVFDPGLQERGKAPNLLNDGVIEKDFIASGLAVQLAKPYFDLLKGELDERMQKVKRFRPYKHAASPQLSVEALWQRFAPELYQHYELARLKSDQCTLETFAILNQLYLEQAMLPPDMVKQFLLFQQNQQGLKPDPMLERVDLSLYGFHSLEDWFGPRYVEVIGQFILNAAALAEERGYAIGTEEIRADLIQNVYRGYQQLTHQNAVSHQEVNDLYRAQMQAQGADERTVMNTWKKVMLFRRLFEDVSGSVLVDPLAFRQFQQYSKQSAQVELFELPTALQLSDFRALLKFQTYLEAVAPEPARLRTDLTLLHRFASLEQVEKRCPDLVERDIELEYAEVLKADLASALSLKETWNWEGDERHFELLKKQFPEVAKFVAGSREERLSALDRLSAKVRLKVDHWARMQMVGENVMHIKDCLAKAPMRKQTVGFRLKGGDFPFAGVKDRTKFLSLLEQAPLGGAPNEALSCFTGDGEAFYRVVVHTREGECRVLALAEASHDGTLDQLLDKQLEAAYPEMKKIHPATFQTAQGGSKPFKDVKDQIGRYLFADLLSAIEKAAPEKIGELALERYAHYRLFPHAQAALRAIQKNPADPAWVKQTEDRSLESQWLLTRVERPVERGESIAFSKEEMFALEPEAWSSVKVGARGAVGFYRVLAQTKMGPLTFGEMDKTREMLCLDAKRAFMRQLLSQIKEQQAIHLSKDPL